ncbi:hypothetical protein CkaCkLH20_08180 [Colletotrichum karsti]|uniref:Uncharacterized protein n=1 Tax=Colletotrichum karsti TaxID=1095194 RepID=A0A9P6HZG8_9PEZI|nr:uncharacterized protein CkaCkLH20_08180 [Colletotrichum karsti]KAF9874197.1 hypothetical protein CkaCkLH20_08180 [Colletotrichum karsti]
MDSFGQPTTGVNGTDKPIAVLKKYDNGSYGLLVYGSDFLIRGGELASSSMTSALFMSRIIDDVVALGVNTIFGVVSWKNIEPIEGVFDFTELDAIIALFREKGLYLSLRWNGTLVGHGTDNLSDSVPSWVKTNAQRFPKVKRTEDVYDAQQDEIVGKTRRTTEAISLFGDEIAEAEQNAFHALIGHIKLVNKSQHTIVMVQVGSLIGFKRNTRDYSVAADAKFDSPVPTELLSYYQAKGSAVEPGALRYGWDSFGQEDGEAETLFSAYYFATYVEALATICKRECGLPVFTDVAVNRQGPALHGSAEGKMMRFWRFFTPSLSFFAARLLPGPSSKSIADFVARNNQPLLILGQNNTDIEKIWVKFGNCNALGVALTRIEAIDLATSPAPAHFCLLRDLTPTILTARNSDKKTVGFALTAVNRVDPDCVSSTNTTMCGMDVKCQHLDNQSHRNGGWGIVVEQEDGTLLVAGQAFQVKAKSLSPKATVTRVLDFVKKEVEGEGGGSLRSLRRFTAEDTNGGRAAQMPADTPMIAEIAFYAFEE